MPCRTCAHFEVTPDKACEHRVYNCLAEVPPEPPLPACMTQHYRCVWPPPRTFMQPSHGEGCTYYQERT